MKHEIKLGLEAVGRRTLDIAAGGVYNTTNGRLKLTGCAIRYEDTEATYALYLETDGPKPTKATIEKMRDFVTGILYAVKAM